jgi:ubiquinone biosynthesis protein
VSWEYLIDETALARLLPADYAHFARPVKEGLVLFLNGLPKQRQDQILAEQSALPVTATVAERLGLLARSCPVLHKLGQVLARDQRLASELRQELQQLESLPPTVELGTIRAILADELGPLEQLGITLLPPAIAEASVAVVIPYRDDRNPTAREGVFKILKPEIADRMAEELDLLGHVGGYLDARCDELSIPHLDYRETFDHVRTKLSVEVLLDQEQLHLAEAKELFENEPDVHIPTLYEHCTPRVTAMERVFGTKVTDHSLVSCGDKRRLARLITHALIAQPIFAETPLALFHSDPHAGNLFYTREGRLAILDWSLVGHLGDAERMALAQIVLAAITLREARIIDLLELLDMREMADRTALTRVVKRSLRQIRRGVCPGLAWLIELLDDATQDARLRVTADLLLFRKSLHTLEGVLGEMHATGFSTDQALFYEFMRNFCSEWPGRWFVAANSHAYATRLSNADLAETLWNWSLTAPRFWQAELLDWFRGEQSLATRQPFLHDP